MSIDSYVYQTLGSLGGEYGALVHQDPLSPSTIARLKGWIETCTHRHSGCQSKELPQMPTRVLDVGSEMSQLVTLVETQGARGQYIALSHCWGKPNSFITTRSNLEDMKRGFDPSQIPATFRDAIIYTRKLCLRYLWIDSVCIIQKDVQDWEIESSKMGNVYRDAYLTITAENAAGDEEGFLKPRAPASSSLEVIFESGHIAKFYLHDQHYQNYKPSYTSKDDALSLRTWTLQESILSRRRLRFFSSRIIWSCQEYTLDEGTRDTYSEYNRDDETLEMLFPFPHGKKIFPYHMKSPFPAYGSWYSMVEGYSKRQLSFQKDRLPALGGLASLIAEQEGGKYVAGVWWEDVIYGLWWRRGGTLEKCEDYVAPSWSWASVAGPVVFQDAKASYSELFPLQIVTFKDYKMQYRGVNNFGQVDGGWIKLDAPVASFSSLVRESENGLGWFTVSGIEGQKGEASAVFDFEEERREVGDLRLLFLLSDIRDSGGGEDEQKDIVDVFGIVIAGVRQGEGSMGEEVARQSRGRVVYRRVGSFLLERSRDEGGWFLRRLKDLVTEVVLI